METQLNSMLRKQKTKTKRKYSPEEMAGMVVSPQLKTKVKTARTKLKKNADVITVAEHKRIVGTRLPDTLRKIELFAQIELLCKLADRSGVTSNDRSLAKNAIDLLEDVFLSGQYDKPYLKK